MQSPIPRAVDRLNDLSAWSAQRDERTSDYVLSKREHPHRPTVEQLQRFYIAMGAVGRQTTPRRNPRP